MYKLFMAFRYLRAHKIIYFSIVGVAVGIMTMVVVTSLMGGFSRDMKSRIRGLQTDIVVLAFDKNFWITDYDQYCKDIESIPNVVGCAPRLEYDAWLGRRGSYSDVHIVGIVPAKERNVSRLEEYFRKGMKQAFDFREDGGGPPPRNPGVVLGAELRNYGTTIGLLTARHATTPILCVKDFDVVGRFRTGMNEYDTNYVFMDLASAQEFLQVTTPPAANVLAVKVKDYERNGQEVRRQILEKFHARSPCAHPEEHGPGLFGGGYRCGFYRAVTWEQTRHNLLQAVEVEKGMQYILLSFIILVAGFNIVAVYTLVVRAKTRDIGILRALGGTEGGVTSIFLMSGGICGFIGSIFGIILGLLIALNLNEILDFIRVVSREMNRMGLQAGGLNRVPRGATFVAGWLLLVALGTLIWNWLVLYRERQKHPWTRMVVGGVALAAAAWFATGWMPDYRPNDHYDADFGPNSRWVFTLAVVGIWTAFCAVWRVLDRYRRRPSWIFFGFAASIFMVAAGLAVLAPMLIAAGIILGQPDYSWEGLELFSRKIYYLDRVPVFVDYGALVYIVIWTLFVSFCCSIYPALRAAAADPVEAIRDE